MVVIWFLVIVRDNLGMVMLMLNLENGVEWLVGLYVINYEVVDGFGNSKVCIFLVKVIMF